MDELKRAKHRALYLLERCDRTEQELRTKLSRNYEPEIVEAAIRYVKEYEYIDDKRYAVNYLKSRGQIKSRRQIEQELLYKKGISRDVLEEACMETEPQDERLLIRRWMEKKHMIPETATQEEQRRFYLFLMRRGFQSEDILHELRNILQSDIRAKQLELYLDAVDVINEEIYCDKLRLNQVLLNLLSNAVKYTTAGGIVSVRVTEKPGAPAGYANYEFNIKDTGIGMSEDFVLHIFEPFERERTTTISGIEGAGLGMAITKNIVDMMNGTIDVKSEQGVGTEFTVSFTFRLSSETKSYQEIPELKNCRALVVDDDFDTCDSVSFMLGQLGLRAEWTLSGKEAVLRTRQASMRGDCYSVYIIDWLLPDMNGIEVTRRIRKEMGEDVPVIVLTAYDWSEIENEAKEAGVTAFCSKPLFLSELSSCLNSVVNAEDMEEKEADDETEELPSGRILLAEDNELNQEIAVAILEEAGIHVEVAGNGQIAVEMLENSEPDYYQLILMDVKMPVMNGYEATKTIRKLENRKLSSIPIFAMTANAFEEDKREALNCGMNGHLAKPIDVEKLFNLLKKVLR